MEEKESQARALLDKTNRQFNECNALYHAAAQRHLECLQREFEKIAR